MSEYHPTLYSYSSNPTPQPYPPGVYPYPPPPPPPPLSSYAGGLQMAYPAQIQASQTWVTDQVVTAGFPTPSMGYGADQSILKWPQMRKKSKAKPKRNLSNTNQSVRCELCDIYCTSIVLYEMHLAGKKHLKTLQKKYASSAALSVPTSQPVVNGSSSGPTSSMTGNSIQDTPAGPIVGDLGLNKQNLVDGARVCSTCNVLCNSEKTFSTHCAGKRHRNQLKNVDSGVAIVENSGAKRMKLMQAEVAEGSAQLYATCNIGCSSELSLAGKEHANEEKAITSASERGMGCASSVSIGEDLDASNEKVMEGRAADESKSECISSNVQCINDVTLPEDAAGKDNTAQAPTSGTVDRHDNNLDPGLAVGLDAGNKKVAERSQHLCTTCSVICNSALAFAAHIAGKKHATQVRKSSAKKSAGDSEANGQKVEGSGTPSTTMIECSVCKIVCNSESVMKTHLAGKKHAIMVKKLAATSMPDSTTT